MPFRRRALAPVHYTPLLPILLLVLCASWSGCAGSSQGLPNDGKSLVFLSGRMNFDIECVPTLTENGTGVDVYWGIPPTSLSFGRRDGGFLARYLVTLRLRERGSGAVRQEGSWAETTFVTTYAQTQRVDPLSGMRRLESGPGDWLVEVIVEDLNSGISAPRMQAVSAPDPSRDGPSLGRIVIESRRPSGKYAPVVFFHVPSGLDSLSADLRCFRLPAGVRTRVVWRVDRFQRDTVIPFPPYIYGSRSMTWQPKFREIEFTDEYLLCRDTLDLTATGSETRLFFRLPEVLSGMYRISVQLAVPSGAVTGADTVLAASRVISVKGPTFPRPSTLDEFVDALSYIATEEEIKRIRSAKNPEEKRERFDIFWLARAVDRQGAASLLKSYYTRVEEANRYFTALNEGWKTDRGMLYIVLGIPAEIENSLDAQTWYYNYPGGRELNAFSFRKLVVEGGGVSLPDFVLYRDALFEGLWKRAVSRWRLGQQY